MISLGNKSNARPLSSKINFLQTESNKNNFTLTLDFPWSSNPWLGAACEGKLCTKVFLKGGLSLWDMEGKDTKKDLCRFRKMLFHLWLFGVREGKGELHVLGVCVERGGW